MRRPAMLCALALCLACGNSDNLVYGGVGSTSANYPDAAISDVKSAIHYSGTITDVASGQTSPRSIVILSAQDGLCANLAAHPDYFHGNSPEDFAALILMTPAGLDGDFFLEVAGSHADVSLMAGHKQLAPVLYPGVSGDVSVSQFDLGGDAKGTFSFYVHDASLTQYAIYGNFKTNPCGAIANAYIPRTR